MINPECDRVPSIDRFARIVWEYHLLHHPLKISDAILALGSHDPSVARWGAELYLAGWAPWLICCGGIAHTNDLMVTDYGKSEAEYFAEIARSMGVPEARIIIEKQSQNTGDNYKYASQILEERGLDFQSFLVVQKPYMERRAYATGKRQWPSKEITVTSPPVTYDQYVAREIPKDDIINIMVGDLQRIIEYPRLGFQIPQEVPTEVMEAYAHLVRLGYTKHLIKS